MAKTSKGKPRRRRFFDAPTRERCKAVVTLSDRTTADCGRRQREGSDYCWQHADRAAGSAPTTTETSHE